MFLPRCPKSIFGLLILLAPFVYTACYYDSEEELYGNIQCKTGIISYSADVVPVLSANCYSCHSIANAPVSGNGIVLQGYSNLTSYLADGKTNFIESVTHTDSASRMPKNGSKLDKCSISNLQGWIEQGTLNN